jgi:integral membrane protein
MDLLKTQIGRTRIIAFVEGVSFLIILFVTMPLKYMYAMPEPNKIFGMVHGVLFILYVLAIVQSKIEYNWSIKKLALAFLASIVPFGTFWADKKLFNS